MNQEELGQSLILYPLPLSPARIKTIVAGILILPPGDKRPICSAPSAFICVLP